MRYLNRLLLVLLPTILMLLAGAIVLGAAEGLFSTDERYPAKDVANVIVAGKVVSKEGVVAILNLSADQLRAERERIDSLGTLTKKVGWVLVVVSFLQCVVAIGVLRERAKPL